MRGCYLQLEFSRRLKEKKRKGFVMKNGFAPSSKMSRAEKKSDSGGIHKISDSLPIREVSLFQF
jgi:hypothetical protein